MRDKTYRKKSNITLFVGKEPAGNSTGTPSVEICRAKNRSRELIGDVEKTFPLAVVEKYLDYIREIGWEICKYCDKYGMTAEIREKIELFSALATDSSDYIEEHDIRFGDYIGDPNTGGENLKQIAIDMPLATSEDPLEIRKYRQDWLDAVRKSLESLSDNGLMDRPDVTETFFRDMSFLGSAVTCLY